jgi:hypothetical protein
VFHEADALPLEPRSESKGEPEAHRAAPGKRIAWRRVARAFERLPEQGASEGEAEIDGEDGQVPGVCSADVRAGFIRGRLEESVSNEARQPSSRPVMLRAENVIP